jgi:hypothetical protein
LSFDTVHAVVTSTGVEVVDDAAAVRKRVSGGADAVAALRREGERLQRAAHPGVVAVLRSEPVPGGWELVLSYAGRSLATLDRPSLTEAATIVAGLASTLADLHELGITHGRVEPSHVLVGDRGRPRLCGFGEGEPPAAPEDDVAALGALLDHLVGADDDGEPIPERRWGARHRWRGWERRALLLLADQASAEEPSRRPTARRLAAAIAATVPSAADPEANEAAADELLEQGSPTSDPSAGIPRRRALPILLGVLGLVVAVAAVSRLRSPEEVSTASGTGHGPSAEVEVAAPVPGSLVVDDGRRYRVGQEGDHLLVADWSCDGRPTPAVYRPATHEVFVFDHWTSREPLTVRATATVADAVEMVSGLDGGGCPRLSLRTSDGALVPVSLEGQR